jgi:tubulin polyglutamylase TTLL6/13
MLENFPKPYTKAEARMINADEKNTDETIMEEVVVSTSDAESSKDLLPKLQTADGEEEAPKKKKKKRFKFKAKKLVLNVSLTKYHVVRYIARSLFNMHLSSYSQNNSDCYDEKHEWDLLWTDGIVKVDTLYRMKGYQRINHFPGMYALARKDHLARNLGRMQKHYPDEYHFFPQTWLLPAEYGDFRKQFKEPTNFKKKTIGRKTFISKPEASC